MLEAIHSARVGEFRRILRACAIAASRGKQALMLLIPAEQDPAGFVRAFHRYCREKAGRPVRLLQGDCQGGWVRGLARTLGLDERVGPGRDAPLPELLGAADRLFERMRAALAHDLATDGADTGPGLLIVNGEVNGSRTFLRFLQHLSPGDAVWRACASSRHASQQFVVIGWQPAAGSAGCPEGVETVAVRPFDAEDLKAAADAAARIIMTGLRGAPAPCADRDAGWVVGRFGTGSAEAVRDAVDSTIEAGLFHDLEPILDATAGAADPMTRLRGLVVCGRVDEALALTGETSYRDALPATVLIDMAFIALARVDLAAASGLAEAASRRPGDGLEARIALLNAEILFARADLEGAAEAASAGMGIEDGGDLRAALENTLGKVAYRRGLHGEAEAHFVRARDLATSGDREDARAAHNLGLVALRRGQYARAVGMLQEATVLADGIEDSRGAGLVRRNLAIALEYQGRYQTAMEYAVEAVDRLSRLDRAEIHHAVFAIADLLITFGEWDRAMALVRAIEEHSRSRALPHVVALCAKRRGECALLRGDAEGAIAHLASAREGFAAIGFGDEIASCESRLAEACLAAGRMEDGLGWAEKVLVTNRSAKGLSKNPGRSEPESIRDAGKATTGFRAEGVAGTYVEARVPVGNEPGARSGPAQQTRGYWTGPKDEASGRALLVKGLATRACDGPAQAMVFLGSARDALAACAQREPLAMTCAAMAESLDALGDTRSAADLAEEAGALIGEMLANIPPDHRRSFSARPGIAAILQCERAAPAEADGEDRHCREAVTTLAPRPRLRHLAPRIVGDSPALRRVLLAIERVRDVTFPVLLRGESGTGKELMAEAIHLMSPRSRGPFVRVNAAAFTDTLLISELFGHEKGAYTGAHARKIGCFEAAHGGTLFLDEIGDISEHVQTALLRVIETQAFERVGGTEPVRVDVRLVFATNRDLDALMKAGRFRGDLYHRVSGISITVPALRERAEDIPALVGAFLDEIERETGRRHEFAGDAMEALCRFGWPGNIRELKNVVRKLCVLGGAVTVTRAALAEHAPEVRGGRRPAGGLDVFDMVFGRGLSLFDARREMEVALIREALGQTGGNISAAAQLLGMKRPRLSQLVKEYELKVPMPAGTAGAEREQS